jgi:hypothetical protein
MRPGSKHSTLLAVADAYGGVGGRVVRRLANQGRGATLIVTVSSLAGVANGEMDVPSDAVLALTGHPPMAFEEFLRRNPENYRHLLLA